MGPVALQLLLDAPETGLLGRSLAAYGCLMRGAKVPQQDIVSGKLTAALVARIVLTLRRVQMGLNVTGQVAWSSNDQVAIGASEGAGSFRRCLLKPWLEHARQVYDF